MAASIAARQHDQRSPITSGIEPGRARRERALFRRAAAGDTVARSNLAELYMPLARSLAVKYLRSGEAIDDLLQVASIGLLKAIDRYDLERGTAFSSYAVPTITGELKRYFRDYSWAVRPPRALQELTQRVDRVAAELAAGCDRAPTAAEIATAAGISQEDVLEAVQARSARGALSLQAPSGNDGTATIADRLGSDDGGIARAESQAMLDDLLTVLSPRERLILRMRFEEDLTQAEIGAHIGVSQMQVSRLIRQALQRLRAAAERAPREPPSPAVDAAL